MSLLADLVALPLGPLGAFLAECREFDPQIATALSRVLVPGEPPATVIFGPFHPSSSVGDRVVRLPDPRRLDDAVRERATPFVKFFHLHELGHLGVSGPGLAAALHGSAPVVQEQTAAIAAAMAHHQRWGGRFTGLAVAVEDVRVDRWVLDTFQGARAFMLACHRVIAQLDGDPVAVLATGGALERLCGAIFAVGRYVLTSTELPSPTRELVEGLGRSFENALAARSDLEVVEATAALLLALERLAQDSDGDDARGRAGTAALDVLTEPSPQVRGGCLHDDATIRNLVNEIITQGPRCAPTASPAPAGPRPKMHGGSSISGASASRRRCKPLATYRVLTRDFDEIVSFSAEDRRAVAPAYRELVALSRGSCASIIDELADLLRGETTMDLAVGARSGFAIDPAAFPAIAAGAAVSDVWMRTVTTTKAAGSAAVLVLVDLSGSMKTPASGGSTRCQIASVAITALHLALAPSRIPHAIVGYTSISHVPELTRLAAARARAGEDLDAFARTVTATRHYVFKPFDDADASAIGAMAPGALNLDGEAVAFGLDMLRQRDEALRLLVVLTDGEPSNIRDGRIELHHLRQAVARGRAEGVRCIGVGIASDAVREAYPEHIVVDDLTTLGSSLLGLIRRVVLDS
ncbi:MAG: hypothetical protein IT379_42160 [Deltaproteobacteria bacterium]|nr:hypothetical protein [Deltaproteobacteria bacterium]